MPMAKVTQYLERARTIATLADKETGDKKKRMLDIAEAWLKLADEAALDAARAATVNGETARHPKPH